MSLKTFSKSKLDEPILQAYNSTSNQISTYTSLIDSVDCSPACWFLRLYMAVMPPLSEFGLVFLDVETSLLFILCTWWRKKPIDLHSGLMVAITKKVQVKKRKANNNKNFDTSTNNFKQPWQLVSWHLLAQGIPRIKNCCVLSKLKAANPKTWRHLGAILTFRCRGGGEPVLVGCLKKQDLSLYIYTYMYI